MLVSMSWLSWTGARLIRRESRDGTGAFRVRIGAEKAGSGAMQQNLL
jgi:hypothetical protein